VQKFAPNPNKKASPAPAESTPAHAESNSVQAQPSSNPDAIDENDKKEGDSGSDNDMSGLLSDSDEE
jgi:hypothetical protein